MKAVFLLLLLLLIMLLSLSYYFFCTVFKRGKTTLTSNPNKAYETANTEGADWLENNKETKDIFINSFDGLKLKGLFVPGNRYEDKTILCVHGYKTQDGLHDFGMSVRFLCSTGYNILIVDDRAHGSSEGTYIGFSILDSKDVVSWCKYLVRELKQDTIVLYGISMGAATVINAAGDDELPEEVKGLVSDCGFADARKEIAYQIKRMYKLPSFPVVDLYDMWLRIFAKYSLNDIRPIDSIQKYHRPLLMIHGNKDRLVPTANVYELYEKSDSDKDILVVDGASHGKSYLVAKSLYENRFMELLEKINDL